MADPKQAGGDEPYRSYNWKLLLDNGEIGHFTACSGLGVRVQPIAYREGGERQIVRQLAGPVIYSEVTLSYGLIKAASEPLWRWFMSGVQGNVVRMNPSIVMLSSNGAEEVLRWNLMSAWVSEWRGAPLDAMSRDVAIETLTLVYESLERA